MFSLLDRYVARTFLLPWLLCLVSVLGLYIVIDMFSNLGDLLEQPTLLGSLAFAARYYATFIPLFLGQVMPMITLLGAMIALVRLDKHNELTTLKACGVSFQRTLVPLFAISGVLAVALLGDQEYVVPRLARTMRELEVQLSDYRTSIYERLYAIDASRRVFVIDKLDTTDTTDSLSGIHMVSQDQPDQFIYAETGGWRGDEMVLWNVFLSKDPLSPSSDPFAAETPPMEPSVTQPEMAFPTSLTPEQLKYNRLNLAFFTIGGLRQIYHIFPHMAPAMLVEIHRRLAFCAANVVLLLVAIPFAFQQQTRSALVGVGVSLLVALGYYFLVMVCSYLGGRPDPVLSPQMAGWLPVVAFGGLGLYLYRTMPT